MPKAKPDVLRNRMAPRPFAAISGSTVRDGTAPAAAAKAKGRRLACSRLPALLWALRKRLGLAEVAMGKKLGIPFSRVSEFETGHRVPSPAILRKLSPLMHVQIEDLRLLRAGAIADREFARGGSVEEIRERVVSEIEGEVDLRQHPLGPDHRAD